MRTAWILVASINAGCVSGSLMTGFNNAGSTSPNSNVLRWSREDTTEKDYLRDRYECLHDAQEQRSSFGFGRYYGAGESTQATNASLFIACMNGRGYVRDDAGPFGPPADGAVWAD